MTQDFALQILRDVLLTTALLAAPVLMAILLVGALISILQAATQIQEMTLTFIPKLAITVITLMVCGSWMLATLKDFAIELIRRSVVH